MELWHVTESMNVKSIWRQGLLVSCCRQKVARIWLCSRGQLPWSFGHVAETHGVFVTQLAALQVQLTLQRLRRWRRGIWYSLEDIGPRRLSGTVHYWEAINGTSF